MLGSAMFTVQLGRNHNRGKNSQFPGRDANLTLCDLSQSKRHAKWHLNPSSSPSTSIYPLNQPPIWRYIVCLCKMCQNIFRYSKFYSVTMMLSESVNWRIEEIAEKYRFDFRQQMSRSNNDLVSLFSRLSVW